MGCDSGIVFKMPAVLQMALLKIFRGAVGVHFASNCTTFRCTENHTQDYFRRVSGMLSQFTCLEAQGLVIVTRNTLVPRRCLGKGRIVARIQMHKQII